MNATDATERLRKYQRLYGTLEHKYLGYKAGEELSGCPPPSCPTSSAPSASSSCSTGCTRYTSVINSVSEFNEMPWHEVSREMGDDRNHLRLAGAMHSDA